MSEELVEALAERFYYAYWRPTEALTGRMVADYGGQPEAEKKAWKSAAKEAVRQMEWARRDGVDVEFGLIVAAKNAGYEKMPISYPPLTLAPPDWKP